MLIIKALSNIFKSSKKQFLVYLLVPMIIGLVSSIANGLSLTSFVNSIFLIGVICLIFSGFIFLQEKGAFVLVNYSFRKFKTVFTRGKVEDYVDRKKINLEDCLYTNKYSFTKPLFAASIFLTFFSYLLSIAFY